MPPVLVGTEDLSPRSDRTRTQPQAMTLRELFDSVTSSAAGGFLPIVLPSTPPASSTFEILIDNPRGVPAHYAVARLRRTGRPVAEIDVSERRVGVPTRRTIQLPLDEASVTADHLITIRAGGRTSKLVLYRELLAEWLKGTTPEVSVAIAATGTVRFSISQPVRQPGAA